MIESKRDGLYDGQKRLTNFRIDVAMMFTDPTCESRSDLPTMVEAVISLEAEKPQTFELTVNKNIAKEITEKWSYCVVYGPPAERKVHQYVVDQILAMRQHQARDNIWDLNIPQQEGYIIPQNGSYELPNGEQVIAWNGKIAGSHPPKVPCKVLQRDDIFIENNVLDALDKIVNVIFNNVPEVLLALVFALITSVRSCIKDLGYYFQAALYIIGKQSVGKTTLARRVLGFPLYSENFRPALFLEAVSTEAAVRDALAENPNLPVVLDDLAISSEKSVQKQRKKLGAAILRLAANDAVVTKKSAGGSSTIRHECRAGLALTAEFPLDSLSELTRCVVLNITQRLKLTDDLTPALCGCVVSHFVDWFADNFDKAANLLQEMMQTPEKIVERFSIEEKYQRSILLQQQRVQRNFILLYWTFSCFMEMVQSETVLSEEHAKDLWLIFTAAMNNSIMAQLEILGQIEAQKPDGNLAYIILEGLRRKNFSLCHKKGKLFTHDGIIWTEDDDENPILIGIREEALVRFVRNQNGYQQISSRQIKRQLKDWGVLVLQETKGDTVHLGKPRNGEPNIPRVLLLRMAVLADAAECYKPDEEDMQNS